MRLLPLILLFLVAPVNAGIYKVGPTRTYSNLNALFNSANLGPGDIVEVDGGVTYPGGVVVPEDDGGAAGNPLVIRGIAVSGQRPRLTGSTNTIEFRQSDHVVLDGFDISGGTSRCVFQGAHDVTIRNSVIHDCVQHGILSTDQNSGSFTLEYSEIYNAGSSTNRHPLYIQSDEITHPGSVFRMRFCYVHNGNGGNLLKSRHERSEIYYNWFEGATYHELELIGPDEGTQLPGWSPDLIREDADVVGNVIVHTNPDFGSVIRVGGDGSGESRGRVRFVNNTILLASGSDATVFRIFDGIQSVEMHNNVIDVVAGGTARIERTVEAVWTDGRQIHGSNNWVESGSTYVPSSNEWSGTLSGSNPGFVNAGTFNLMPQLTSHLVNAGNNQPSSLSAFPFPSPLSLPAFIPQRKWVTAELMVSRRNDGRIDIGAYENVGETIFVQGFE